MKKIVIVLSLFASVANAQVNQYSEEIDLLKAPTSPGFILLNQQPTDIERPITPTDFAVSIRNSSNNFSALPKNYAVELAPTWLFRSKEIGYEKAFGINSHTNIAENILQTLNLSVAYAPVDSLVLTNGSQFGIGVKFSIVRGATNPEFTKKIEALNTLNQAIGQDFHRQAEELLARDSNYVRLDRVYKQLLLKPDKALVDTILIKSLSATMQELVDLKKDNLASAYKSEAEVQRRTILKNLGDLSTLRTGGFLDFAAGMVVDFPSSDFDYSEINKYGAWLTGGYDGEHFSIIGLGRMLQNTKTPFKNDSNFVKNEATTSFDSGLRFILKKDKFSTSLEGLYRNYIGNANVINGFKGTFFISYDIGNNKLLTLNISRDFDGTLTKKGNLVTALNLIIGLGGKRNIN